MSTYEEWIPRRHPLPHALGMGARFRGVATASSACGGPRGPVTLQLRWTEKAARSLPPRHVRPRHHKRPPGLLSPRWAWTALDPDDTSVTAAYDLMRATSVEEATEPSGTVSSPRRFDADPRVTRKPGCPAPDRGYASSATPTTSPRAGCPPTAAAPGCREPLAGDVSGKRQSPVDRSAPAGWWPIQTTRFVKRAPFRATSASILGAKTAAE